MKAVVMDLLRQYLKVEIQFQNGECYSGLRINSVVILIHMAIGPHLPTVHMAENSTYGHFHARPAFIYLHVSVRSAQISRQTSCHLSTVRMAETVCAGIFMQG